MSNLIIRSSLDIIYIQAKRWENTVSRPEIQKFAGALQGQRAKKEFLLLPQIFQEKPRNMLRALIAK